MKNKDDKLLSTRELARRTGTSTSYWEKLRSRGGGPRYIRVAGIKYREFDVAAWMEKNEISAKEVS